MSLFNQSDKETTLSNNESLNVVSFLSSCALANGSHSIVDFEKERNKIKPSHGYSIEEIKQVCNAFLDCYVVTHGTHDGRVAAWRVEGAGYTTMVDEWAVFSKEEAERIVSSNQSHDFEAVPLRNLLKLSHREIYYHEYKRKILKGA